MMAERKIDIDIKKAILIDASYLDFVCGDMKKHFSCVKDMASRKADLSCLVTYLALDAGMAGKDAIDVVIVYDRHCSRLCNVLPDDLDGTGVDRISFKEDGVGEFSFMTVQPEGFAERSELYMETLDILLSSGTLDSIALLAHEEEYGQQLDAFFAGKEEGERKIGIVRFGMFAPEDCGMFRKELLAYPIMKVLGINASDLKD